MAERLAPKNQPQKTQKRGRERRKLLMQAAEELLETHQIDTLQLSSVAEQAGIPKSSAYHFYKDIHDLYADLVAEIGVDVAHVLESFPMGEAQSWEDIVLEAIATGGAFLDARSYRRQLIWGAKSPFEIKRADRRNDRTLGLILLKRIQEQFDVPDFPRRDDIFYHAIEIADLMFCLCMLESERLTPNYLREAQIAAVAYLRHYLPRDLPRRTTE